MFNGVELESGFQLSCSGRMKPMETAIGCRQLLSKLDLIYTVAEFLEFHLNVTNAASSETRGQLVGTKEFSWAKVYCNRATSPWALCLTELVPEAFEFPAFDWPEKYFSGQSAKRTSRCAFLHEVVFLIDHHSCVGRSKGGFSTRFSQKFSEIEQIANLIWPQENTEKIFMADLSKVS